MEIGVFLPTASAPGESLGDVVAAARRAEELGLESVWVVDQLIVGTGAPLLDSTVALTAAAAVTTRVRLGFGVLILPLHPIVWAAKQIASLQHVSGGRVILGVGIGGDRHTRAWLAAGVPRRERGARADAALRALPGLLAGQPTRIEELPDAPTIQLAPAAVVPPIIVGGSSQAALRRSLRHGDGWWPMGASPSELTASKTELTAHAAAEGKATPASTASMMVAISGDPALPSSESLTQILSDPDGQYGIPVQAIAQILFTGGTEELAARLVEYRDAGAERLVVSLVGGEWAQQAGLLAEARALL